MQKLNCSDLNLRQELSWFHLILYYTSFHSNNKTRHSNLLLNTSFRRGHNRGLRRSLKQSQGCPTTLQMNYFLKIHSSNSIKLQSFFFFPLQLHSFKNTGAAEQQKKSLTCISFGEC